MPNDDDLIKSDLWKETHEKINKYNHSLLSLRRLSITIIATLIAGAGILTTNDPADMSQLSDSQSNRVDRCQYPTNQTPNQAYRVNIQSKNNFARLGLLILFLLVAIYLIAIFIMDRYYYFKIVICERAERDMQKECNPSATTAPTMISHWITRNYDVIKAFSNPIYGLLNNGNAAIYFLYLSVGLVLFITALIIGFSLTFEADIWLWISYITFISILLFISLRKTYNKFWELKRCIKVKRVIWFFYLIPLLMCGLFLLASKCQFLSNFFPISLKTFYVICAIASVIISGSTVIVVKRFEKETTCYLAFLLLAYNITFIGLIIIIITIINLLTKNSKIIEIFKSLIETSFSRSRNFTLWLALGIFVTLIIILLCRIAITIEHTFRHKRSQIQSDILINIKEIIRGDKLIDEKTNEFIEKIDQLTTSLIFYPDDSRFLFDYFVKPELRKSHCSKSEKEIIERCRRLHIVGSNLKSHSVENKKEDPRPTIKLISLPECENVSDIYFISNVLSRAHTIIELIYMLRNDTNNKVKLDKINKLYLFCPIIKMEKEKYRTIISKETGVDINKIEIVYCRTLRVPDTEKCRNYWVV